mgnify:CR=1 FL=1
MIEHMNEPQIREQLTISQQQGTLVEVYNFADDDTFNVGFVIAMDPLFVLLMTLDWDCKINGLTLVRIKSIHAVRSQTDYLTTCSYKSKVAQEYGYFDIFGLQRFLREHDFSHVNLLNTLLKDSIDHELPVVIGTQKYKGRDDFEGMVHELTHIGLTLHYYNEHDLSSLWTMIFYWPRLTICGYVVFRLCRPRRLWKAFFTKIKKIIGLLQLFKRSAGKYVVN